ncbi:MULTISPECIES: hypothetical protein [Kribbella]|uniref:Uncharacterized protein n=1 Tax=Kribbella karoonensis TaxID=324851 RepID=A0ABN2DRZ8_9ACTN
MTSPARIGYVDRHGHRINRTTWRALSARPEYVVIASDLVDLAGGRAPVITIWLGLYLPAREAPVFETVLHPIGGARARTWRWSCLADARTGHQDVVCELASSRLSHDRTGGAGQDR